MYRVIQFGRALTARVRADELQAVAPLLGPRGLALFQRLSRRDQRHALDVYLALRKQGYEEAALLLAALLHDIGKTASAVPLPYRIAVTLLQAFSPGLLSYLAARGEHPVWVPFRTAQEHPEIGARLLMEADFPATVVELTRHHHDRRDALALLDDDLVGLIRALQQADGAN